MFILIHVLLGIGIDEIFTYPSLYVLCDVSKWKMPDLVNKSPGNIHGTIDRDM